MSTAIFLGEAAMRSSSGFAQGRVTNIFLFLEHNVVRVVYFL